MKALMVGKSLDTNGQKQRFVEAARRWGEDPDVLKALIVGRWDGAGIPARLAEAAERGEGLSIRSAHRATAYFDFPVDILWSRQTHRQVLELAEQADVIHLTNDVKAYIELRMPRLAKPAVLHHHGTLFRSQHSRLVAEAKRFHMVQAVSTIDLMRHAPDLHWLPAPIDVDAMQEIRALNRLPDDGTVRIMSSPTRRDLKSTDLLMRAVGTLKAEGLPVELILVESRSWAECLAVKATADIYFDQVAVPDMDYPGGYGCNAIEAWAMGIPVIAGADEWTTDRMLTEFGGKLPFYAATEHSITDALRNLVTSKAARNRWGKVGLAHVQRFHAEKPALLRLVELYRMAITKKRNAVEAGATYDESAPGTFRTELLRLVVPIGNQRYRFVDQHLTIDNPVTAQKMRRIAQLRTNMKISEVEYQRTEDVA